PNSDAGAEYSSGAVPGPGNDREALAELDVEAGSAGLVRVLAAASRCATAQVALGWARLRSSPHRPVDRQSRPERRRLRQVLAVLWELPQNQLGAGLLALHWVVGAVRSTRREHGR